MTWLDKWHARQRSLDEWVERASKRFELRLTLAEEATAFAKLGLCVGGPLLAAPLLTAAWYPFRASGEAAYYWMAAAAFGGSILAYLRAHELAITENHDDARQADGSRVATESTQSDG